jgi:hypothetical protein
MRTVAAGVEWVMLTSDNFNKYPEAEGLWHDYRAAASPEAGTSYLSNPALFHRRSAMLFSGGKAIVNGSAQAYDPVEGTWLTRSLAETIQLRGAKNP